MKVRNWFNVKARPTLVAAPIVGSVLQVDNEGWQSLDEFGAIVAFEIVLFFAFRVCGGYHLEEKGKVWWDINLARVKT